MKPDTFRIEIGHPFDDFVGLVLCRRETRRKDKGAGVVAGEIVEVVHEEDGAVGVRCVQSGSELEAVVFAGHQLSEFVILARVVGHPDCHTIHEKFFVLADNRRKQEVCQFPRKSVFKSPKKYFFGFFIIVF